VLLLLLPLLVAAFPLVLRSCTFFKVEVLVLQLFKLLLLLPTLMAYVNSCTQAAAAAHLEAFTIALEHTALSSSPQVLCAAARACRAWRQAVQQCPACNTVVELDDDSELLLQHFRQWLPKHAALVKSIGYDLNAVKWNWYRDSLPWPSAGAIPQLFKDSQQLLQQALEAATGQTADDSNDDDSSKQPPSGQQQQQGHQLGQQQQGLRLRSLSNIMVYGTAMLAALPAHSLTHLDFMADKGAFGGPSGPAGLARLTSLQQLRVVCLQPYLWRAGCLASIAQLSRLTYLTMEGPWYKWPPLPQEQLQFPSLPLQQLHLHFLTLEDQPLQLNLSALTRLTALTCTCRLADGLLLPPQLQRLQLGMERKVYFTNGHHTNCSASSMEAVLQLQQLQQLHLHVGFQDASLLLQLSQVTPLQQLALAYQTAADAAATAHAWPRLQHLQRLHLDYANSSDIEDQTIITSAAACTGLKQLKITGQAANAIADAGVQFAACSNITDIRISNAYWLGGGRAQWLTAFTALTRLELNGAGSGVGDNVAIDLACSLPQLQHLGLGACKLQSVECMAAIGRLLQLTELRLVGNSGLTQQGLMQLTGLQRLQQLWLDDRSLQGDGPVKEFWSRVQARGSSAMH
jgi:hypothetical protein